MVEREGVGSNTKAIIRIEMLHLINRDNQRRTVARSWVFLIPGNVQGQVGRGSEHADLAEDVPAHCRGVGLDL